jgi:hypothetical protein
MTPIDLQEINRALFGARPRRSSIGPNDGLVNLSWPLILILSISAIVAAGQAEAISDANRVVNQWKDEGKEKILLDLWKQALIHRVEAVCREREESWKLNMFPHYSRVSTNAGWPADKDFGHLCCETEGPLSDTTALQCELYAAALAYTNDNMPGMYDTICFPNTAPDKLGTPNVLGESEEADRQRKLAQKLIAEKVSLWNRVVRELQNSAILTLLDSSAVETVRDPDRIRMKQRIRQQFGSRGFPLLP